MISLGQSLLDQDTLDPMHDIHTVMVRKDILKLLIEEHHRLQQDMLSKIQVI